jgi:hypothetical protein
MVRSLERSRIIVVATEHVGRPRELLEVLSGERLGPIRA